MGTKTVFDAAVAVYRDLKPCNVKLPAAAVSSGEPLLSQHSQVF